MEEIGIVALVGGLFGGRVDVVQFQLARLIADHQKLFARRESATHERFRVVAERPDRSESRVDQFAIHSASCSIQFIQIQSH